MKDCSILYFSIFPELFLEMMKKTSFVIDRFQNTVTFFKQNMFRTSLSYVFMTFFQRNPG